MKRRGRDAVWLGIPGGAVTTWRSGRAATSLPEFLRGFSPDLVVRKEGDCAVVVIKTREEVIGSNEIVEMAARVDAQPGWRLEFVSLGRRKVAAAGPSEQGLEQLMASALAVYDAGSGT